MSKTNYLPLSDFGFVVHPIRGDQSVFPPSLTRQEFAEECDINTIMARYESGGAITHVNRATPSYMDMTEMPDLRGALDIMRDASIAFASLPAKVRKEFDNDPQKFVDFAQSPENLEKMREWGLAPMPDSEPLPFKVEVVSGLPPSADLGDEAKPLAGKPAKLK